MATITWSDLARAIDGSASAASIDPNMSMSHDGMALSATLSFQPSPNPAGWQVTAAGDALTLNYEHDSSDDARDSLHIRSETGTFNYVLSGTMKHDAMGLQVIVAAQSFESIAVSPGPTVEGPVLNLTVTANYAMVQDIHSRWTVTPAPLLVQNLSQPLDFGILVQEGLNLQDETAEFIDMAINALQEAAGSLADPIFIWLNGGN